MDYEDTHTVRTPEGLTISFVLAGIGSRFVALLLDSAIQGIILLGLTILIAFTSSGSNGFFAAAAIVGLFVVLFGYWLAFETLDGGRSPGKRLVGLRVVRVDGAAIGFRASAARTLGRIIDILPTGYVVGMVTILCTRRNQRVGDLLAGTVVIHVPKNPRRRFRRRRNRPAEPLPGWGGQPWGGTPPGMPPYGQMPDPRQFDLSSVTTDQVALARSFLERRNGLTPVARQFLAADLAGRLRPLVRGAPVHLPDEQFLEWLAAVRSPLL